MGLVFRPGTDVSNGDSLCDFCASINLRDLKTSIGYEHQPTYASLLLSSPTCTLCDLVTKSVKRSLKWNRAFNPRISDNCGPVRLACAGRSVGQQSGLRRCPEGPVEESLLWREVAILIGEKQDKERGFGTLGAQLVMVAAKDSAASAAGVQEIEENSRLAFSAKNIQKISKLLQTCRQKHQDCSLDFLESLSSKYFQKYKNSGLPSRLIDVTMKDESKVKLVSVKGRYEYLALSYCWGKFQSVKTTTKNLAQMQAGVKIAYLAKSIQDAIFLCRKLDFRYLWVDALCIIQDGDGGVDWSLESQKMALIYAQSYATIAAASAESSDESFLFEPRRYFVSTPFRELPQTPPTGGLLFCETSFDFAEHFETATYESALAKRAWVMQERLFSRRTIHFTTRQIYWECRSLFYAENGEATTTQAADSIKSAAMFMQSLRDLAYHGKTTFNIYMFLRIWSELIDDYSKLKLTYQKDRLPGIEGLARAASLVFPGRYLCGIWEYSLSSGLLWTPKERPMMLAEEKWAPSWSWASTTDAVRSSGVIGLLGESDSRITLNEVLPTSDNPQILVLSGQIQPCHMSLESEPKPVIRRLKDADPNEAITDHYRFWPSCSRDLDAPQSCPKNTCCFDGERGNDTEFFFFRLECSEGWTSHCRGLLLRPEIDDSSGQLLYKRIGVGWASHRVWHETTESVVRLK